MYILILVDEGQTRDLIKTDSLFVQVIPKGKRICGLHYKGKRPSLILDGIKEREFVTSKGEDIFEAWMEQVIIPCLSQDGTIVEI